MSTLFVGNLSWGTTSEILSAFLSESGAVSNCDTGSVRNGRTRGWAIVECGSEQDAANIIASCNDADLEGRQLVVRLDAKPDGPARPPKRSGGGKGGEGGAPRAPRDPAAPRGGGGDPSLENKPENSSGVQVVVRNLPWSVTSDMLRGTFEQIGPVDLADVVCHADSGRSKGWGTVRFQTPTDANDAIVRFGGVELAGRPMTVMMDRYN